MNLDVALKRSNTTLYGQIANLLREQIASGFYKPGDVLPSEREIAAKLDVSRIPVREALKSLEYLGVVRQERSKGVVVQSADLGATLRVVGPLVSEITPELLDNLFDFRLLIEPFAAQQAAINATQTEIDQMLGLLEKHRVSLAHKEAGEEVSFEFHYLVMQASHNQVIEIVSSFLTELQKYSRRWTLWNDERRQDAYDDHYRIFHAIATRDPVTAREEMKRHLTLAKKVLPCAPVPNVEPPSL